MEDKVRFYDCLYGSGAYKATHTTIVPAAATAGEMNLAHAGV
jgi:hypothetical protein